MLIVESRFKSTMQACFTDQTLSVYWVRIELPGADPVGEIFHVAEHFKALDWLRAHGCTEYQAKAVMRGLDHERDLARSRRLIAKLKTITNPKTVADVR